MSSSKRIIAVLLSVLTVIGASGAVMAAAGGTGAEPTVTVGTAAGSVGEVVQVPISLSGNPGIVSMSLEVAFDSAALRLTDVTDTGLMPGEMHSDRRESPYALTWENDTVREDITVNGQIATLSFEILAGAEGSYPISLRVPKDGIYDVDVDNVDFALVNGSVTVGAAAHSCVYSWKNDEDEHWKVCTDPACGKELEGSRGSHRDADLSGLCDACGYDLGVSVGTPTVMLSTVCGEMGDTVEVNVMLLDNPGIVSMSLSVGYDESALELVGVVDAGVMPGEMHSDRRESPYALTWENDTVRENITVSGVIATLRFKVLTDAAGDYVISLQVPKDGIYNVDVEDVAFALVNGAVTVGAVDPGFTVSGTVVSYIDDSAPVTVRLLDGAGAQVTAVTVTDGSYELVADGGVYQLEVSKKDHVTRVYEVALEADQTCDVKLCPVGDVTGDGRVTIADYGKILNHCKRVALLDGYAAVCADVNGDGRITIADYGKVLNHCKRVALLWGE